MYQRLQAISNIPSVQAIKYQCTHEQYWFLGKIPQRDETAKIYWNIDHHDEFKCQEKKTNNEQTSIGTEITRPQKICAHEQIDALDQSTSR